MFRWFKNNVPGTEGLLVAILCFIVACTILLLVAFFLPDYYDDDVSLDETPIALIDNYETQCYSFDE